MNALGSGDDSEDGNDDDHGDEDNVNLVALNRFINQLKNDDGAGYREANPLPILNNPYYLQFKLQSICASKISLQQLLHNLIELSTDCCVMINDT